MAGSDDNALIKHQRMIEGQFYILVFLGTIDNYLTILKQSANNCYLNLVHSIHNSEREIFFSGNLILFFFFTIHLTQFYNNFYNGHHGLSANHVIIKQIYSEWKFPPRIQLKMLQTLVFWPWDTAASQKSA